MGQSWDKADYQAISRIKREIIRVQCHSGYTYAEKPVAFNYRNEDYKIDKIEKEWREPEEKHFLVLTRNKKIFELCYNDHKNEWSLV